MENTNISYVYTENILSNLLEIIQEKKLENTKSYKIKDLITVEYINDKNKKRP